MEPHTVFLGLLLLEDQRSHVNEHSEEENDGQQGTGKTSSDVTTIRVRPVAIIYLQFDTVYVRDKSAPCITRGDVGVVVAAPQHLTRSKGDNSSRELLSNADSKGGGNNSITTNDDGTVHEVDGIIGALIHDKVGHTRLVARRVVGVNSDVTLNNKMGEMSNRERLRGSRKTGAPSI